MARRSPDRRTSHHRPQRSVDSGERYPQLGRADTPQGCSNENDKHEISYGNFADSQPENVGVHRMESASADVPDAAASGSNTAEQADLIDGLTRRDREILTFERQWWKYAGAKEQAIRELFDMSATRYYQVLNTLIDAPAALAVDPLLVKRLRRLRAGRQRQRSARRLGIDV